MWLARTLELTIGLCLITGLPAQTSKVDAQKSAPPLKKQAASRPTAARPSYPFDPLTKFSATMVGSLIGNAGEARIYRSGNIMRVDSWNGMNYYVTNLVSKDTYVVLRRPKLKQEKCLREHAALLQAFPFTFFRPDHKYQSTPEGEDEFDGHHCHVLKVIRTTPSGTDMHVKFWQADDLEGFPVKIEVETAGNVNTITYKDVKIGAPDPAVFKVPKHCEKGPGK